MLGFEQTATGYRATDEQVEWWKARDTCPACGAVHSPVRSTDDRFQGGSQVGEQRTYYLCTCEDETVTWSRLA
jgi:hypothetical protein